MPPSALHPGLLFGRAPERPCQALSLLRILPASPPPAHPALRGGPGPAQGSPTPLPCCLEESRLIEATLHCLAGPLASPGPISEAKTASAPQSWVRPGHRVPQVYGTLPVAGGRTGALVASRYTISQMQDHRVAFGSAKLAQAVCRLSKLTLQTPHGGQDTWAWDRQESPEELWINRRGRHCRGAGARRADGRQGTGDSERRAFHILLLPPASPRCYRDVAPTPGQVPTGNLRLWGLRHPPSVAPPQALDGSLRWRPPCCFSPRQTVRGSAWGRGCRGGFPGAVGSGGQSPPHSFARVPPKVSGRAFAWGTFLYKMAGTAKRTQAQKSERTVGNM